MTKHLKVLEEYLKRYKKKDDADGIHVEALSYFIDLGKKHEAIEDSGVLPAEMKVEGACIGVEMLAHNACREETKARLAKNLSIERMEKEINKFRENVLGGKLINTKPKTIAQALHKELLGSKE